MAFLLVKPTSSGDYQTLFNRLIEDPETIDLTSDTPTASSSRSIPFDGLDDTITLSSAFYIGSIGVSGASANNVSFDTWFKYTITGNNRTTFFQSTLIRSLSSTTTGFDGIYEGNIILTGGNHYIEFRYDKDDSTSYVLTSSASVSTSAWHNVFCSYLSGEQRMQIYIDGTLDSNSSLTEVLTGTPIGARGISFGGRLDEMRLWIGSAAATAISKLASASSIGVAPENLNINEMSPSSEYLVGWWRFETVSAFQLFSGIQNSILDSTVYGHHATPSGFQGSDVISSETTIIDGISASGDLKHLLGGTLDHGGLIVLDPNDDTIKLEWGAENLIDEEYNSWSSTGTGVTVTQENNNIFYGSSSIKVNTTSANTGVYQDISNSALLFSNNTYTCSFRYRSISGSTSARTTFTLGNSASSVTAVTNTSNWNPVVIRNTLGGTTLTGRIDVIQLNSGINAGALFQIDGLMINEGDYLPSFVGPDRVRKTSQITWPILD